MEESKQTEATEEKQTLKEALAEVAPAQPKEESLPPIVVVGMWPLVGVVSALVLLEFLHLLVAFGVFPKVTPKWEYKVESVSDIGFERGAGELGAEGWQVVSARRAQEAISGAPKYEFVLMRPATSTPPKPTFPPVPK